MTPKQIERILKKAAGHKMTPTELGKMLAAPPHDMTPVEATQLMDQYKAKFPEMAGAINLFNQESRRLGKEVREGVQSGKIKLPSQQIAEMVKGGTFPRGAGEIRTETEPAAKASLALTKRSLVKKLALEASKELRAGKFTRVSAGFLDMVEADFNGVIRDAGRGYRIGPPGGEQVDLSSETVYLTGNAIKAVREMLNQTVVAIVRARVKRHPSIGSTLKE